MHITDQSPYWVRILVCYFVAIVAFTLTFFTFAVWWEKNLLTPQNFIHLFAGYAGIYGIATGSAGIPAGMFGEKRDEHVLFILICALGGLFHLVCFSAFGLYNQFAVTLDSLYFTVGVIGFFRFNGIVQLRTLKVDKKRWLKFVTKMAFDVLITLIIVRLIWNFLPIPPANWKMVSGAISAVTILAIFAGQNFKLLSFGEKITRVIYAIACAFYVVCLLGDNYFTVSLDCVLVYRLFNPFQFDEKN